MYEHPGRQHSATTLPTNFVSLLPFRVISSAIFLQYHFEIFGQLLQFSYTLLHWQMALLIQGIFLMIPQAKEQAVMEENPGTETSVLQLI